MHREKESKDNEKTDADDCDLKFVFMNNLKCIKLFPKGGKQILTTCTKRICNISSFFFFLTVSVISTY